MECFLWCLSTISVTLLVVKMEMVECCFINNYNFHRYLRFILNDYLSFQSQGTTNPIELIRPLILIFWSFATVVYFCEYGDMVTSRLDEIKDVIWQGDWYAYPNEIQRILPMIVANAQQPVVVHGFGNLVFTRLSIKQVSANAISFMVY